MAMDKERPPLPNLHIRTPTHVFPSGRITLALMMLTTGLFLVLSTLHPATFYQYPMPTDISPQETKIGKPLLTSINLSALSSSCRSVPFFFSPFSFFWSLLDLSSFPIWYSCAWDPSSILYIELRFIKHQIICLQCLWFQKHIKPGYVCISEWLLLPT